MNLRKPFPPFPLWILLLFLIFALLYVMGCASTCEPIVIKEPVEVEVPVPIPPEPLMIPVPPALESCEGTAQERVRCIRRNIERMRNYTQQLLDEIEAHNSAIEMDPL